MARKKIENTPVYESNRLKFVKREYTKKEQEIIDKYTGKITTCPEGNKQEKLSFTQSLGRIRTKKQLLLLESYLQGARDAKEGVINIFDLDQLTELYHESYEAIYGTYKDSDTNGEED